MDDNHHGNKTHSCDDEPTFKEKIDHASRKDQTEPNHNHTKTFCQKFKELPFDRKIEFFIAIFGLIFAGALTVVTICQLWTMKQQTTAMQGQLDAMISDQRPWLSSIIGLNYVRFVDDGSLAVALNFTLKNTGKSPARNIMIVPELHPFMKNEAPSAISKAQDATCQRARKLADENKQLGPAVFQGEERTFPQSTSVGPSEIASGDFPYKDQHVFLIFGCIDYTFGSIDRHGKTGFRLLLGQSIDHGRHMAGIKREKGFLDIDKLMLQYEVGGNYAN